MVVHSTNDLPHPFITVGNSAPYRYVKGYVLSGDCFEGEGAKFTGVRGSVV